MQPIEQHEHILVIKKSEHYSCNCEYAFTVNGRHWGKRVQIGGGLVHSCILYIYATWVNLEFLAATAMVSNAPPPQVNSGEVGAGRWWAFP